MAGKKPCGECDRRLPIAIRVCECGYLFPTGKSSKICQDCGKRSHNARKTCPCGYVFKPPVLAFKESPIELTTDRLRPRRIRMKCQIYDEGDFIYNMSAMSSQDNCFSEHSYDNNEDFYNKDMNDAALESIANSLASATSPKSISKENVDVNLKQDVSKYMERLKKETHYISNNVKTEIGKKFDDYISTKKSEPCNKVDEKTQNTPYLDRSIHPSSTPSESKIETTPKKSKLLPQYGNVSPLSSLIRGQVTKAMQTKLLHNSPITNAQNTSLATSDSDSRSQRTDSQSESEEDNIRLSELFRMRKPGMVSSFEESPGTEGTSDSGIALSTSVPLIAGLPGSAQIDTKCTRGGMKKRGRPRKHRYNVPCRGQKQTEVNHSNTPEVTSNHDPRYGTGKDTANSNMNNAHWNEGTDSSDTLVKVTCTSVAPVFTRNGTETVNSTIINPEHKPEPTATPTPTKRGRPKGCRDTKKRKPRQDYIGRLMERNVNVDAVLKARESIPISRADGGYKPKTSVQRGRPSLMASDKSKHTESHGECRMGSMNAEEIEQIERRLNTTNPWIIPDHKRELFSLILGEINHRIASQSFQATLKP